MPHAADAVASNAAHAPEIPADLTIPKLFLQKARHYGEGRVAMREKEFGIWRPITWQEYLETVKYTALGLIALGLEEDDKVAMIGDNRPEGLMAEMAALCARGIGVWLFQDCLMDEVRYIIDHSDTKFLFGEGQDDDVIGGYGHDWISGGTGQDGVLGDDGDGAEVADRPTPGEDAAHENAPPGQGERHAEEGVVKPFAAYGGVHTGLYLAKALGNSMQR